MMGTPGPARGSCAWPRPSRPFRGRGSRMAPITQHRAPRGSGIRARGLALLPVVALMAGLLSGGPTGAASASPRTVHRAQHAPAYRAGELLVRFQPGTPASTVSSVNRSIGARTLKSFTIVSNLQLVRLPAGLSVDCRARRVSPAVRGPLRPAELGVHLAAATERPSGVAKTPDDPRTGSSGPGRRSMPLRRGTSPSDPAKSSSRTSTPGSTTTTRT